MNNKFYVSILIVSALILTFGIGMLTGIMLSPSGVQIPSGNVGLNGLPLLAKVIESVRANYYEPERTTEEGLAKAMLFGLDPYSTYFNNEEYKKFQEDTTGNYSGIGVVISLDEMRRHVVVAQVFSPSPAATAGVQEGWFIVAVDGKELQNPDLDYVSTLIRGPKGKPVAIVFQDNGTRFEKTIIRDNVKVNTVTAKMVGDFAYIKLSGFMPQSPAEMDSALTSMEAKSAKGYILDLRRNGGGLLQACQMVANLFLDNGVLVYTQDRTGNLEPINTEGKKKFGYPLAVLVDQFSASASEILTGALQDRGVAKVIGTRTFGKGLVQNVIPLPGYGTIKLTIERYLTPNKTKVDQFGIKPDIDAYTDPTQPLPKDEAKDTALQKAIEYLKGKTK